MSAPCKLWVLHGPVEEVHVEVEKTPIHRPPVPVFRETLPASSVFKVIIIVSVHGEKVANNLFRYTSLATIKRQLGKSYSRRHQDSPWCGS